jgi:hypothetical protein
MATEYHDVEVQPLEPGGWTYVCEQCGRYVIFPRSGSGTIVIVAGDEITPHRGTTEGLTLHVGGVL